MPPKKHEDKAKDKPPKKDKDEDKAKKVHDKDHEDDDDDDDDDDHPDHHDHHNGHHNDHHDHDHKGKHGSKLSDNDEEEDEEGEDEIDPIDVINSMPLLQRRRIYALKGLQKEFRALRKKFLEEVSRAEREFMAETAPLRAERAKVVSGQRDVTDEEVRQYQEATKESVVEELPSDEDGDKAKDPAKKAKKAVKVVSSNDEDAKGILEAAAARPDGGIPGFWYTAMQNSDIITQLISERDVPCLQHITDITKEYIDNNPRKGFTLSFHFSPNEWFKNETLTKKYLFDSDPSADDANDPVLETIEGCDIDWTSQEKKLTVVLKQKKQRHKSGKGVRVVTREEKCPSFFNFFEAPKCPESDEDESDEDDEAAANYDEEMQMDYEAATVFADGIIPRAAYFYSGKAIEEAAVAMEADFDGMYVGDDDEEDEEEEPEEEHPGKKKASGKGGVKAGGGKKKEKEKDKEKDKNKDKDKDKDKNKDKDCKTQ